MLDVLGVVSQKRAAPSGSPLLPFLPDAVSLRPSVYRPPACIRCRTPEGGWRRLLYSVLLAAFNVLFVVSGASRMQTINPPRVTKAPTNIVGPIPKFFRPHGNRYVPNTAPNRLIQ